MDEMRESTFDELPKNLHIPIKSIICREGFITYKILCKNLSSVITSYMGILFEVDIIGNTAEDTKEINTFIKYIVENENMTLYSVPDVARREEFAYNELAKIFDELQNEAKISEDSRFVMAKSFEESNAEYIILEHLGKQGFKVYPRTETVTFEYAKLSIEQLAKFHALSFVLQNKSPEYLNEKISNLKQPFVFGKEWYELVRKMCDYSVSCLEPEVREKYGDAILKKTNDYPNYMTDNTSACTLCHGDYKLNNVMAKEIDGTLAKVIPIDYQLLHYGCPILDFLYFIFNGTDQEFRKNHLTDLKNFYYATMKKFLEHFGMDIEEIYPKLEFERVYKEKLDFGLMINCFYVPFLFAADDNLPEVNESLNKLSFKVDERFTKRFRGVVDDFVNWGYI